MNRITFVSELPSVDIANRFIRNHSIATSVTLIALRSHRRQSERAPDDNDADNRNDDNDIFHFEKSRESELSIKNKLAITCYR